MKLQQALLEYNTEVPYSEWMKKQVNLWKNLTTKGIVQKNDLDKFKKFGRFFDKYYNKTHHFPTTKEVEQAFS